MSKPAARMTDQVLQHSPHCHAPIHPPAPVPTPVPHPGLPLPIVKGTANASPELNRSSWILFGPV